MSDGVLDEALAIRDALKVLKKVRSVKDQYKQMMALGLKMVTLVYTYKLGEQHSDSDRYTQELKVLLETIVNLKKISKPILKPHFKMLRWYARQTVRILRGLLNAETTK